LALFKYIYNTPFDLIYTSCNRVSVIRNVPNTSLESRIMPKPQCIQYLRERIKIEFQSQSKEV